MNLALWLVSGGFVAGINSLLQKWSVDRMGPDSIKFSYQLLFLGLIIRMVLFGAAALLALRAGFAQTAFYIVGVFVGKWAMLFFWLNRTKMFSKGFGKG